MATNKKMICPLMQKPCIEDGTVVDGEIHACKFWVQVQGKHPQSGETINHYDCTLCWTPVLMIENSKVNRETGAAVESLRNELMSSAGQTQQVILQTLLAVRPPPSDKTTIQAIETKPT